MALPETAMVPEARNWREQLDWWGIDMGFHMKKYPVLALILFGLIPATIHGAKLRLYPDWFMNVEMAGTIAAIEKGWYKKEGIDLEIVFKDLTIIPRIEKGEADIGMDTAHSLIQYIGEGADLKAFSAKYQASPHCIIVPHDSKIMSVADLKGKTLAEYAPQDRAIYQAFLGHAGLSLKDVKFKKVHSPFSELDIIEAFRKKEIDAILAWEFNWTLALRMLGYEVRAFPGGANGFHYYGIVYFAKPAFIEKNKELLAKFLKVSFKGWEEVYKRPRVSATCCLTS